MRDAAGVAVADGVIGELHVRGPHLMNGYDDDPRATAEVLVDGWFATGDVGYQRHHDGAGVCFFLTGRAKNVAKVRGEQIALEEIENALLALPGVVDAACGTTADRWDGERIVAGVVSAGSLDLESLRGGLAPLVPAFGIPSAIIAIPQVPRTPTGKILRAELAALLGTGDQSTISF